MMHSHPHISADPKVMSGVPCIKGTRVTDANIVRQVAAGRNIQEICEDYPYLSAENIRSALEFAADITAAETHDLIAS